MSRVCKEHTSSWNGYTIVQSSVNTRGRGYAQHWVGLARLLTPTSNTAFTRRRSAGVGARVTSSEERRACEVWVAFVSPPSAAAGHPGMGGEGHAPSQPRVPRAAAGPGAAPQRSVSHLGSNMTDPRVCAGQRKPSLSFSIEEILKKPSASTPPNNETSNRSSYAERPPSLKAGSPVAFSKYQL